MAGNPVIASVSLNHGYELTWLNWFTSALIPGILCLLAIPHLQYYLSDSRADLEKKFDQEILRREFSNLGQITLPEMIMIAVFSLLLVSWILLPTIIHPTAAALIAVTFLLVTKVLSWEQIIQDKSAWTTFLWLTTLLMLSSHLKDFGAIDFLPAPWQGLYLSVMRSQFY